MDKKIPLPVVGAEQALRPEAGPATAGERSVLDEIDAEVKANKLIIYMKGSPEQPMCGFSARASSILSHLGVPYAHVDVLQDAEKREGIKQYGEWPTIPQVYLDGELLGGSDILLELYQSGELNDMVQAAFGTE
jgi:monothiol glutaredoxin